MKAQLQMPLSLVVTLATALFLASPASLATGDPDIDPPLAPLPPPPAPPDNPITQAKADLGMMLFFDPKLTGDASLSCGDCHDPKQGWGFNDPISRGYPGAVHWRNSQTVVNTAYLSKLFWQGNAKSLEAQAPIANKGAVAGNGEDDVMEARLRQTPYYIEKFREVFGTQQPNLGDAWMAVATFERTLSQQDTPLDRYLAGDLDALSEQAVMGKQLFEGKANCIECHNEERADGDLDLTDRMTQFFSVSYENLITERRGARSVRIDPDLVPTIGENHPKTGNVRYLPTRSLGSHNSLLMAMLLPNDIQLQGDVQRLERLSLLVEAHAEIEISAEDLLKISNWVDTNAQYYGSYYGRRNLKDVEHPNFRPEPTWESAIGICPLPEEER